MFLNKSTYFCLILTNEHCFIYNTPMVDKKHQEHEEPGISLLREWLPKVNGENRAFIKGAAKALLYVQEGPSLPSDISNPRIGKQTGN